MGDIGVGSSMCKRDVGITVNHKLSMVQECDVWDCINRSRVCKTQDMNISFFLALVGPQLEYMGHILRRR